MDIRFGDHPSFHRAAVGMVGASATLGLALHAVTPVAPIAAGLLGIGVGAAIAYGKPLWRIGAAAAACVPFVALTPSSSLIAMTTFGRAIAIMLAAVALALAMTLGLRGTRGLVAMLAGAAVAMLAIWAGTRFGAAQQLSAWPSWARDVSASAAMGMIGVLALLPRHLRVALDPVQAAARRLSPEVDGEVRELCNRSLEIWNGAKDKLADSDPGKRLVRDGVLKTLEVAAKSAEVQPSGASEQQLARRMEDLDARIAAATDSEVKAQYQSARSALDDQRRYRDHIKQNRERLVARMHNHVAALEKFQLAASGLVAARAASAGATAVRQLEELSQDVAASGEALAEIELAGAPDAAAEVSGAPDATTSVTVTEAKPAEA
jgi:hypothetical protein